MTNGRFYLTISPKSFKNWGIKSLNISNFRKGGRSSTILEKKIGGKILQQIGKVGAKPRSLPTNLIYGVRIILPTHTCNQRLSISQYILMN